VHPLVVMPVTAALVVAPQLVPALTTAASVAVPSLQPVLAAPLPVLADLLVSALEDIFRVAVLASEV